MEEVEALISESIRLDDDHVEEEEYQGRSSSVHEQEQE
jgi:hypothetical protein